MILNDFNLEKIDLTTYMIDNYKDSFSISRSVGLYEEINVLYYIFEMLSFLKEKNVITEDIFYEFKGYLSNNVETAVKNILNSFSFFQANLKQYRDVLNYLIKKVDSKIIVNSLYELYLFMFFSFLSILYSFNNFKYISRFKKFFSIPFYLRNKKDLFNTSSNRIFIFSEQALKKYLIKDLETDSVNLDLLKDKTKEQINNVISSDNSISYLNNLRQKSLNKEISNLFY
jgi:hypothetical protein